MFSVRLTDFRSCFFFTVSAHCIHKMMKFDVSDVTQGARELFCFPGNVLFDYVK